MNRSIGVPLLVKMRLDGADAEMLRRFVRGRGNRNMQSTIVGVLREFEQRIGLGQEAAVEELTYRRLYFELLDRVSSAQDEARALLVALDQAMPAEVFPLEFRASKKR